MIFYETVIKSIGPTSKFQHFQHFHAFCVSRSQKFSKKKYVSIDMKCSKMYRNTKKIYPFDPLLASRVAQNPSNVVQ